MRRSSRLSAAVPPQASPCSSSLTPRRVTRRSLALALTPVQSVSSPAQAVLTPAHLRLHQTPATAPEPQPSVRHSSQKRKDTVNVSLCFSPVKEVLSSHPDGTEQQSEEVSVSEPDTLTPAHSLQSISVAEEQSGPADAMHVDLPVGPRLSLSPARTPSFTPTSKPSLSFMLSPCATPSQPSVCGTPDASVEVNSLVLCCLLDQPFLILFNKQIIPL